MEQYHFRTYHQSKSVAVSHCSIRAMFIVRQVSQPSIETVATLWFSLVVDSKRSILENGLNAVERANVRNEISRRWKSVQYVRYFISPFDARAGQICERSNARGFSPQSNHIFQPKQKRKTNNGCRDLNTRGRRIHVKVMS